MPFWQVIEIFLLFAKGMNLMRSLFLWVIDRCPLGSVTPLASRSPQLVCKSSLEGSAANKPFCITPPKSPTNLRTIGFLFTNNFNFKTNQVRLADGSRVVVRLNTFHTVWFSSHVLSNYVFHFLLLKFKKEILKHWVGCPSNSIHPVQSYIFQYDLFRSIILPLRSMQWKIEYFLNIFSDHSFWSVL